MRSIRGFLVPLALSVWLVVGCSMPVEVTVAEKQVDRFHKLLDAGSFSEIYTHASQDLKNGTSEADLHRVLGIIHQKLGTVRKSKLVRWGVEYQTSSDTFTTLTYRTMFARGEATETFVYRVKGDGASLVRHRLTSNTG